MSPGFLLHAIVLLLLALPLAASGAEPFRIWTEAESGREIEAFLSDVKPDKSQVRLVGKNGKAFWIDTGRLVKADQDLVKKWVKPMDHLSARVIASGDGWKRIEVKAEAGTQPLKVVARRRIGDRTPAVVKNIKPGGRVEFTYKASNEYIVKVYAGKKVVETESWKTKKGL